MSDASGIDPALTRMLAGELAKSLWDTAKPQPVDASDGDDAPTGGTSAVDTFSSLFTDVLANAIAGTDSNGTPLTTGTKGTAA